ncbi:UDP-N-acetylmuramoyl-tripeptide--D-alanyl-D-alanine ligase [Ectothiorhodospiraceae bacterium BW-2]|nr:UDP-N-acetylmuramoyl-tripeptide--D-alanyl-D-alanine ligase [Ectothiorhodospiraceae bacterium BW-2]
MLRQQIHYAEVDITGLSSDSRTLQEGALYLALCGERFNGHDFMAEALARGAAAMVVESAKPQLPLPQLVVEDSRLALGEIGRRWRLTLSPKVIGLTGSNGKTSVKNLCAALLEPFAPTLATCGNLNNDIGVPQTLLRLGPEHQFAVVEMGANHGGEIGYLTQLVQPDVAVLTNVAAAHLAGFGSLQGVADAKGEIFNALKPDGVAVIPADSPFTPQWRRQLEAMAGVSVVSFGLDHRADVSATWQPEPLGSRVEIALHGERFTLTLPLLGEHNVRNLLAAVAAVWPFGLRDSELMQRGLAQFQPEQGRLVSMPAYNGARLIDDSYNANPASMAAAIEVLSTYSGERILVVGDMGELGTEAEYYHTLIGEQAREAGIERLFGCGPLSAAAVAAFGEGGEPFERQSGLIERLQQLLNRQTTLLVKGSRSAAMDRVVAALRQQEGG